MRDKLQLVALASIFYILVDSGFYHTSKIKDALTVILGGVIYQSGGDFLITQVADNDRIFFDIRFSF